MAASQFTFYSSNNPGGPGGITSGTGSLITILDACLVNGYGTGSNYKAPAGWLKPLPNNSNGTLACYQQVSGSKFTLFVNDSGPNTSAVGREAWVTGWEQMTALSASNGTVYTGSNSAGSGFGQFPTSVQSLTFGHVVWRKNSLTYTPSGSLPWVIAADASTVYLWTFTNDNSNTYLHGAFGDFYSLKGSSDVWKCMIIGRPIENSGAGNASGAANDMTDCIAAGSWYNSSTYLTTAQQGCYIVRNMGGTGGSIGFTKKGDSGVGQVQQFGSATNPIAVPYSGLLSTPNSSDNSLYLSPIWVVEPANINLRGRLRGIYQICHPSTNFADGQTFNGSGDYAGKSFVIIKSGPNSGMWCVETSATIDTN